MLAAHFVIADLSVQCSPAESGVACGCSHGGVPALMRKAMHLASALAHMHTRSPPMVYQDLHPGNVLSSRDNTTWCIVDLGRPPGPTTRAPPSFCVTGCKPITADVCCALPLPLLPALRTSEALTDTSP